MALLVIVFWKTKTQHGVIGALSLLLARVDVPCPVSRESKLHVEGDALGHLPPVSLCLVNPSSSA